MKTKADKEKKVEAKEEVAIDPIDILDEFVSADKKLKAVLKQNRLTKLYEIDLYEGKKKIATESYAFHTRRYHEDAAENYVNGIKRL